MLDQMFMENVMKNVGNGTNCGLKMRRTKMWAINVNEKCSEWLEEAVGVYIAGSTRLEVLVGSVHCRINEGGGGSGSSIPPDQPGWTY